MHRYAYKEPSAFALIVEVAGVGWVIKLVVREAFKKVGLLWD